MVAEHYLTGLQMDVSYPNFKVRLTLLSATQLTFEIKEGPLARTETVDIQVVPIGNSIFAVSWQERDGATVTNIQDFDRCQVLSFATLPSGQFMRMTGPLVVTRPPARFADDRPQRNKALVLDAMTSLFQRRDAASVERLYAPAYIQHNPGIPHGRDALKALVANPSRDVYYEPGLMVAEGNFVAIRGRIRGWADVPRVVVDLFRLEGGKLAEHWDVLQNDVPATATIGGASMFDPDEGSRQA